MTTKQHLAWVEERTDQIFDHCAEGFKDLGRGVFLADLRTYKDNPRQRAMRNHIGYTTANKVPKPWPSELEKYLKTYSPPNEIVVVVVSAGLTSAFLFTNHNPIKSFAESVVRSLLEQDDSVIDEMLELDPWTFDQTKRGWRSLSHDLQIKALRAYVAKNFNGEKLIKSQPPGKVLPHGIIFWHLGQVLALRQSGDKEAIDWMKRSLDPEDQQWNDYAKATIAFLEDDRVSFDRHSQGKNNNRSTLDRLKGRWGRTYREAYSGEA